MAVVGSRKMSAYGKRVVEWLIPQLVVRGYVIVSGMALGVDAWAHNLCLDCGGKTIAVLASGVDVASPKTNEWLYDRIIASGGLIVSEHKNGTQPKPTYFLERNSVIAGLSRAVIVVEGSRRSGTLVTAKCALEQGKEVWAVPGNIFEENSFTPNWLIKNGAIPLVDVNEFILF